MIIGTDVSFWQDDNNTPQKVDFAQMKAAGAKFVICRAGQNLWPDPDFADYWQAAKAAGLPRGSYWFYDDRADPVEQMQLWLSMLVSDRGELPLFLDIEKSYGGLYGGSENWKTALEYLKLHTDQIGIYTAFYYWRDHTNSATRPYFTQYPLWVANYDVSSPAIPPDWTDWLFWQFTDKGDGLVYGVESLGIDLDYFNGDEVAFNERFNLGGVVEPPPANNGENTMYEFVSNNHEISLKAAASDHVLGELVSKHAPGTVFRGDMLFFYPVDMQYARIGDAWLHVTEVAGAPAEGWVVVVHQGVKYGDITQLAGTDPKEIEPSGVVLELNSGDKRYIPES